MPALCCFSGAIDSVVPDATKTRSHKPEFASRLRAFVAINLGLWLLTTSALASPPAITVPPQKRTVVAGTDHAFAVTASGSAPLNYQWRKDGSNLADKTNSTLALTAVQTNAAGAYSVVITNVEGAVTSAPVLLTVRLAGDPLYPTPQDGWAYLFAGDGAAGSLTAALDGTWNHELDAWSGDGRGVGNGLSGGVSTTNGTLTIEDTVTSGTGFNNRRYYFTRNLAQDAAVTNATTLLNDGVTLTFRARLTPPADPLLELTNAPNGLVNNTDGKGMFGLRQAGASGLLISFSLHQATEDISTATSFNFSQAGLHMNNLNGNARSAAVDPGEGGTTNLLALDPAQFHEFWITIADNGTDPGTHRVTVYLDGSQTPTVFNVTAGTGNDGPATNYLALGMGSSAQRGGVDIDYFGYKAGVVLPSMFNQPVGIAAQPASQFVAEGQIATYNVGVTGTPPYRYQWQRDGTTIPGATNSNYSTAPVTVGDAGAQFTVIVSNDCNTVTSSPPALLQLLGAPIITAQPANLTVTNGDPATFTVVVTSPVTPSYQWRFNGGNLANQTNATLVINPASSANAGNYDVMVANNSGSVTSTLAQLTVILFDYGDAPDPTFPTLKASNGARHKIVPGIQLGAALDAEANGQPNSSATGDDLSGSDDEDGVTFLTPLLAGQPATLQVVASTNGFLNAWLDFDRNGSWSGAGEQIFTNAPLVAGTNTIALLVPGSATTGSVNGNVTSQARFRYTTLLLTDPHFDGPAADGEVEDYALTISPVADLSAAQTATPNPVAVNGTVTCVITVSNAGPSTANSVVTTNLLPAGVNFVSVTTSQGSCLLLAGEVTCDLGSLNNGAAATITLALQPTVTGTLTNTLRVAGANLDLVTANNIATVSISAQEAPSITAQPQNLTVTNGSPANFSVTVSGAAPLQYQWRRDGANLNGATNSTLTIPSAQLADAGTYTVQISNPFGTATSQPATLTVLASPSITAQPQSRTNLAGGTATFSVSAIGTEPLAYRWFFNTTNLLVGATDPLLLLNNLQTTNAGSYSVTLSNAAGMLTSAVATLTVIMMDFGDAPDTYRTTLTNNGARHRVVAGIRLGASLDFEPDGQPDPAASGDDSAGSDDEDGVTFLTPIRAGQSVNLTVVASSNGVLNAWLDYNRNGSWAEAGEQIFINRNLPTGTNSLTFIVPGNASAGPSFARFRFSTASGLSFDGEAPTGEVEDYAVAIEGVSDLAVTRLTQISPIATGSEQTYSITVSNAGPSSATGVSITDTLPPGVSFISADASQGNCSHSAGIVVCALGNLSVGATASILINIIPTTAGSLTNLVSVGGNQADLNSANNAFTAVASVLDFPAIQSDPQSQIVTNGGSATFTVSATGTALRYQWRFNGSNLAGATNSALTIANAQPVNAGNYTVLVTNLVGGVTGAVATLTILVPVSITIEPQSQTVLAGTNVTLSVTATGSGPIFYQWEFEGFDLPGATSPSLLLTGVQTNQSGVYRVRVTNPVRTVTSVAAVLTVWQAPFFVAPPESVTNVAGSTATLAAVVAGTEPLRYQWYFNRTNLLAGLTNTSVVFTNVLTSRSGAYTIVASNIAGVSTSAVAVLSVFEMDFGDAPEASGYPTTLAFNGARHRLLPGVRLGALADFETNGLPNATATGDDTNGVDDEDGVTFSSLLLGQLANLTIVASTNGFVDAWIDFNGNGAWSDPGEQVLASRAVSAGANVVPVSISSSALTGLRYARFRFSSAGGLLYDGFAADGEVEDYRVSILPAIDLAVGLLDAPDPVALRSNLFYTMFVTNRGPSTATSVMLTNLLPPGMTYIEARASQGFCGIVGTTVFCPVDNISPGGVVTMSLTVQPTVPGTFTNVAFAGATEVEANFADNTTTQVTTVIGPAVRFANPVAIPVADFGSATGGVPGKGSPYPSTILVTGLTNAVFKVTATLSNVSHQFAKDLDIVLVGPGGQSVMLMSDAGGSSFSGSLTFDDEAESPLPGAGVILPGLWRPSNYGAGLDVFPPPAPAGPHGSALSLFRNTDPNGVWSLYVVDGVAGGLGGINGGWSLDISTADPIADLAVTAIGSPDPVAVNSNLVFSLTVTNRGPAVAGAVMLTNVLPGGVTFLSATSTLGVCAQQGGVVTCTVGSLNAGAGAAVTVTARPTVAGLLTNTTRAVGNRIDLVASNSSVQTVIAARQVTDLVVAQSASTNLVLLGQSLTYTLNVTNRGPNSASNVRVGSVHSSLLSGPVSFISASASQGSCTNVNGVVSCDLASLASGARAQVMLVVEPTIVGMITNTVTVVSDEIDPVGTNNTASLATTVNVSTDLGLTLVDSPDPVAVSNMLNYAVTVVNFSAASATGVQLSNSLPANVNFLSAQVLNGAAGACTNDGGVVRCSLGTLPGGASATVNIVVQPRAAGRLTNSVSVSTDSIDPVAGNNSAMAVTDVASPPVILVQPLSRTLTNSGSVTFVVGASGSAPLAYQWQFNAGGGFVDVAGSVNASFSLPNAGFAARGGYRVRVSNGVGSQFSATAVLTVLLAPTISDIADQQVEEDTPTAAVAFVVGDADGLPGDLGLSAVSSDTALVPSGNVTFGGSGANRTVQVFPALNRSGTATITVQARDGSGLVASDAFVLTVLPVNDPPTVSVIADQSVAEDGVLSVAFWVDDPETPPSALGIALASSNSGLVAVTNVSLSGTGTNRLMTVRPQSNQSGLTTLTLTVTDSNGVSSVQSFVVTVVRVNDLPEISAIPDQSVDENRATLPLPFTVADVETAAGGLRVEVSSSHSNLISGAGLGLAAGSVGGPGGGTNLLLTLRPATNQFGSATITITATDGDGGTSVRSFALTVIQTILPPVVTGQPQSQTVTNGGTVSLTVTMGGSLPIGLQWQFNGTDLAGETNATLSLTNVQASQAGSYRVVATNAGGAATSDAAVLRVLVAPTITSINHSGSAAQISFTSTAGLNYTVEFKHALGEPGWSVLSPVVGTGGVLTVMDPDASASSRIYRVRVE